MYQGAGRLLAAAAAAAAAQAVCTGHAGPGPFWGQNRARATLRACERANSCLRAGPESSACCMPAAQDAFRVLYALQQVKYDELLRFAAPRIILDFLQLLLLVLRPEHGAHGAWGCNACN